MEIARKTDYALRMLATLAADPSGVVSVREAARHNEVPYSFARAIQHDLALAGIVENTRGANGGMRLSVDPHEVTLLMLLEAVQGPLALCGCGSAGDGRSPIWCNAETMLREYFGSITLWQVVEEGRIPQLRGEFVLSEPRGPQRCGAEPDCGEDPDEDAAPTCTDASACGPAAEKPAPSEAADE